MTLPLEVWDTIMAYMPPQDLKGMSLLSKDFYALSVKRLWQAPTFKDHLKVEDLKKLIHLPISTLSISDLEVGPVQVAGIRKFISLLKKMKHLRTVTTYGGMWRHSVVMQFLDELGKSDLKVSIEVGLVDLDLWKDTIEDEIEDVVKRLLKNKINKFSIQWDGYWYLSLANLKCLLSLPITDVDISALDIECSKYDEFVEVLHQMKDLKRLGLSNMCTKRNEDTLLSARELKKLIGFPLNKIYTSALNARNFLESLEVLPKFKYLKEIVITELRGSLLECGELKKMTKLPVTEIVTNALDLSSNNLEEFVRIFEVMKTLRKITLVKANYLFKPNDIILLGTLPVRFAIYSTALTITKKNFKDIVNALKTINLEMFYTDHALLGGSLYAASGHFYTKRSYRRHLLEKENIPFAHPTDDMDQFKCPECVYCESSDSSMDEDVLDILDQDFL